MLGHNGRSSSIRHLNTRLHAPRRTSSENILEALQQTNLDIESNSKAEASREKRILALSGTLGRDRGCRLVELRFLGRLTGPAAGCGLGGLLYKFGSPITNYKSVGRFVPDICPMECVEVIASRPLMWSSYHRYIPCRGVNTKAVGFRGHFLDPC